MHQMQAAKRDMNITVTRNNEVCEMSEVLKVELVANTYHGVCSQSLADSTYLWTFFTINNFNNFFDVHLSATKL